MKKHLIQLKQYPYALLLFVQLLSVLVYGFVTTSHVEHIIANCVGLIVPLLAVWVVYRTPAVNWVGYGLAIVSVGLTLISIFVNPKALIFAHVFESLLYFYAATSLVMYMFADDIVTRDELFAAGATFTLLAWGFALLYSVCQQLYPGSITAAVNPNAPRTWLELLFMSFSIQSGTGIGDVIPISNQARAISAIQMFTALMYITIVVSHLVGLAASTKAKK